MRVHESLALVPVLLAGWPSPLGADVLKVPKQFATIQAAVVASNPGDVIEVSKGVYAGAVGLFGRSNLTLRAREDHVVVVDGSFTSTPILVHDSAGIRIVGIRARNAGPSGVAIRISDSEDVQVVRCRAQGAEVGVGVEGSRGVHVRKCRVTGTAEAGVSLGPGSVGCLVSECTITDSGTAGVRAVGEGHLVEGNTILGPDLGVQLGTTSPSTPCSRTVVRENEIEQVAYGITFVNAGNVRCDAIGNRISLASSYGLYVNSEGGVVERNKVLDPGVVGIDIASDGVRIVDNVVKRSGSYGMYVALGANDGLFVGNVIKSSAGTGLYVHDDGHCFLRNEVTGSGNVDVGTVAGNVWVDNEFGTGTP